MHIPQHSRPIFPVELLVSLRLEVFDPQAADVGLVFEGGYVVDVAGDDGMIEAGALEGVPDREDAPACGNRVDRVSAA